MNDRWAVPGYAESRELGSGASGRVVLAVHEATGVPVAVKYLAARLRTNAAFVRGFRAEARLLGELSTPYVVRLYEYVEGPHGAAIVMEAVDGVALRALLREEGSTGPEAALVVLKGSLLGLAAAHRAGVVHRDYKPENVLVSADGSSKLVDFGIAVPDGSGAEVAGTPSYMAPEQWQGEPASPAADVYAATATFHECLTGRKPYSAESLPELALRHIEAPIPEEGIPDALRPLIARGLAKSPADRPADAMAFVAELETIAGSAYGAGWEERGRRGLAALAALLPLLFPSAGESAGTADSATTVLGGSHGADGPVPEAGAAASAAGGTAPGVRRRGVLRQSVSAAVAAALAAGLFALVVAAEGEDPPSRTSAQSLATTSAEPSGESPPPDAPGPSPGPSPGASAVPSPSGSLSPGGPASVPPPPVSGGPPTGPAPGTSPPSARPPSPPAGTSPPASPSTGRPPSPSPTRTTPPPVTVRSVTVSGLQDSSFRAAGASATVEVTTDGTGPITVTVTWYSGNTQGELGTAQGSETFRRSGARQYTLTPTHTFQGEGCYLAVRATTEPAAPGGGASQQISRGCGLG
ncbi:serine/threonine-protein kinase [Streptomyces sp. CAU 1734]|uniref:serine/threonine-protein kinase n=1 Tax=Streptomyces sp. CAU 1734 TaxID=3140360 RepID=UPI0032603B99